MNENTTARSLRALPLVMLVLTFGATLLANGIAKGAINFGLVLLSMSADRLSSSGA